uniref:Uncharacterized protein n=1 Tax=Aureoumbra lagunensis TaxID=44058 RepID=A0A7S3K3T5_9STRA|mmetsp:Transcript_7451/g.9467  ORF Transcript_7451/g.9467 Transcript_7451/m.9467 type:complete len:250 (-) Transcript_7451:668-1417(-)
MENTQSELSQIIEYRNLKKFAQLILNENKKCIDAVLLAVVQAGWFQGVEFLLKETNASIQEVTPSKNTALHFAAREGNVEIIQILLKFGSEVSSRNSAQQTPVMYAATAGNFAALQKLLQIKQDIQAIDASGRSALDLSCVGALNAQGEDEDDDSSSYAQCVQALLTAGSHPKNALSLVRDALPKIQSEKKQHLVGRILHMLETSMNQFDQEAARNAQLLLEEEINERNRTPPTTTNSKRRIKKQKKKN